MAHFTNITRATSKIHAIHAEAALWRRALWQRPFALFLLLTLLGIWAVAHIPLFITIDVGLEEGYGGDYPLIAAFNTAERDEHGTYRWTQDGSLIRLPALGSRPVLVRLDMVPMSAEVAAQAPSYVDILVGGEPFTTLPTGIDGRYFHMLVPGERLNGGAFAMQFRSETFTPPDDPRSLGVPLGGVRVTSAHPPNGFLPIVWPDWRVLLQWLGSLTLFWVIVLRCTGSQRWAWRLAGGVAFAIIFASLLDPPRWGGGAFPALAAVTLSYGLIVVLRPILPRLARLLDIPLTPQTLGWLLLIVAVAFGMRAGGRLYPLSMWGDIGFHTNRFIETFGLGDIYLLSRNRGINFPYPPAGYLVLAPLILTSLDIRLVLQLVATLSDPIGAIAVYAIVAQALQKETHQKTGLLAAALYSFTAAGIMLTWWSFDTHIYSQCATLILIAVLIIGNHHQHTRAHALNLPRPPNLGAWMTLLFLCSSIVFLGHFGFFMNTSLLGLFLLVVAWIGGQWWQGGNAWARAIRWPLTITAVSAVIVAWLLFYSNYLWLFKDQWYGIMNGGLTDLADRAPVGRDRLWNTLWHAGLIEHFGFFPLVLLPTGMWYLWRCVRRYEHSPHHPLSPSAPRVLFIVMVGNLLISSGFAILPFITLSTQSTRWLTFSAWVMAIGAALGARIVWRRGRGGRLAAVAMAGFVVWNTLYFYFGPMLWRIRPPEPF